MYVKFPVFSFTLVGFVVTRGSCQYIQFSSDLHYVK